MPPLDSKLFLSQVGRRLPEHRYRRGHDAHRRIRIAMLLSLLFGAGSRVAAAAESKPAGNLSAPTAALQPKPWAEGVSRERQDAAERLFSEANDLFFDSRFKQATLKYREALAQWSHPNIHYNLALAFINLDDPIEAHKHLEEALKYDGAPLDEKCQQDAHRHLKATARQISRLEISCRQPGAVISLDGNEIATAPVRRELLLLPGRHRVSVKKAGYLPREYQVTLVPGEPVKLEARIYTESELTESHRPLPFWLPVAVTGLGAGLTATGIALGWRSNVLFERVDTEVKSNPACDDGCRLSAAQAEAQDHARAYKTWATVSIVAGAATVAGGAMWIWFNRLQVRHYTPEEREGHPTVTPMVGSNVVGAVASGVF